MTYAQWFTLRDGRFAELEVVYDPRPFLGGSIIRFGGPEGIRMPPRHARPEAPRTAVER